MATRTTHQQKPVRTSNRRSVYTNKVVTMEYWSLCSIGPLRWNTRTARDGSKFFEAHLGDTLFRTDDEVLVEAEQRASLDGIDVLVTSLMIVGTVVGGVDRDGPVAFLLHIKRCEPDNNVPTHIVRVYESGISMFENGHDPLDDNDPFHE